MSRAAPTAASRPTDAPELLAAMARILVATGESPAALATHFARICQNLAVNPGQVPERREVIDLPHVLTHWHTDPDYLDARGKPRALALRGRNSVESLVRRVYAEAEVGGAIDALLNNGALLEQRSKYLPRSRRAFHAGEAVHIHARHVLRGLLGTIEHNINATSPDERLFECTAANPLMAVRALPAFKQQMVPRALTFLRGLDTDMKRREVASGRGEATTRVGVSVFFYEEPRDPATATARARRSRKAQK